MSDEIENPEQEVLWDQILDAWNPGSISTHLCLAQKYTSEFHRDHQGWAALADALWNLSRFDEAYSALRKAEQRWPEDNEAQLPDKRRLRGRRELAAFRFGAQPFLR